jgi:MarR family transcriptional regulator, organic hydroperoxide resistance regulator
MCEQSPFRSAAGSESLPPLAALWEAGDQRLGDLATMTTIEISTLSRLVGEMKRRGLVTRARLKDNGGTVPINLTPKERIPIASRFEEVARVQHDFPLRWRALLAA